MKFLLLLAAVLAGLFTVIHPASAQTWTPTSAPVTNWIGCASSADGSKLAACFGYDFGGRIYTSADSGTTWIETSAPGAFWDGIACTADGAKIAAFGQFNGQVERVYTSTNSGTDWQLAGPTESFLSDLACSSDGSILAVGGNQIHVSTNWGLSWTIASAWPALSSFYEASSADGRKLVSLPGPGRPGISVSTNSGVTWSLTSAPTNEEWSSVASSVDGNILAATSYAPVDENQTVYLGRGSIYTSADSGATWTSNSTPDVISWFQIVSSADGNQLVAQSDDRAIWPFPGAARIYILKSIPAPVLSITSAGSNAVVAWTIPSMSFRLQQHSNLATTNWTDVTTPLTILNLTNLQNQVTMSRTNSSRFFRLTH